MHKDTKTPPTLGEVVKAARLSKGWTQDELARHSGVSLRTVSVVEGGDHVPRRTALAQLANALNQDPNRLLEIANLPRAIIVPPAASSFPGEKDPIVFFGDLLENMRDLQPMLIIPSFASAPGLMDRVDVFNMVVELVKGGAWIALVFPYPVIQDPQTRMGNLRDFYDSVYTGIKVLAGSLRTAVGPEAKERVNIFTTKVTATKGAMPIIMPPLGISEYRPTFFKFSDESTKRPNEELAAWLKVAGQQKDRMIPVFPDVGLQARGASNVLAFNCWRDYLSDIIDQWVAIQSSPTGWQSGKFCDWEYVLRGEPSQ